jgi:glycosyltransferase involved in cell wall biosynthesis
MKIWLDATPAVHGERAIRRNSRNLFSSLVSRNNINYGLIYFNQRGNHSNQIFLHAEKFSQKKSSRFPMSLLLPCWKRFGEPSIERFVGYIDLLYAPDLYFPPVKNGLVLSTIRGIAYLVKKELINPNHCKTLIDAFCYARSRSDYFLAVSETTRQELLEYTDIPENRIFVVTHGIDPIFKIIRKERALKAVRKRFKLDHPYLIYVGALSINKNILGLIEAFSLVASNEKDIDLVLVGPEETAAQKAKEIIKIKHLEERVHFLGSIEQESTVLTELYNAAEMLVFPSYYEGWCAPPLEAMACGIPVVCSDIPALQEVVGNSAILTNPDDHESIANAISKVLIDSDLREKLIAKGKKHVSQHTWSRSAERLEKVFTKILRMR